MFARIPTKTLRTPAFGWRSLRNLFIQTAETPNEHALKFLPSMNILRENETREFLSGREAACSPLVVKLFGIDDVKSVMLGSNFITIEKHAHGEDWSLLKPDIFSILTESLSSGVPVINQEEALSDDIALSEEDDEVVSMIKELIFTRIRPAIQDDGGDIEFDSFEEDTGVVYLKLKGACRSCDSSSVTLKNGIESMLKYYIEEVQEVRQLEAADAQPAEEPEQPEEPPQTEFEAAFVKPATRLDAPPTL